MDIQKVIGFAGDFLLQENMGIFAISTFARRTYGKSTIDFNTVIVFLQNLEINLENCIGGIQMLDKVISIGPFGRHSYYNLKDFSISE